MTTDARKLVLFDFQTGKWSDLIQTTNGFPNWSRDSQYVYFLHYAEKPAVLRIRISDRKLEQVADLRGFLATGFWRFWLGLDPEDAPLMLRDSGTKRLFARLDCSKVTLPTITLWMRPWRAIHWPSSTAGSRDH